MSADDLRLRIGPKRPRISAGARGRTIRRRAAAVSRAWFAVFAAAIDAAVITLSAIAAGVIYHAVFYHIDGVASTFTALGMSMGLLFVVLNILRSEYEISAYLSFSRHCRHVLLLWNVVFLTALVFVFATKQTSEYSRMAAVLFYATGFLALVSSRALLVSHVKRNAIAGKISALRVVIVGRESEIDKFVTRYTPSHFGVDIVASFVLRGPDTLSEDIALARASARVLRPDDIVILLPLSEHELIDACVAAFVKIPASIHLGPQDALDRFSGVSVSRMGKLYSLVIVRRPLTSLEVVIKRALDLVVGTSLAIGLIPLLALIALAIKIDSRGPVLFAQRRYGFNQETFRILKFRSMTVVEDDRTLTQVTKHDPRLTRVGRFMRRYNIDELPQLLNVLRGEMSLVGPRPHALVHNHHYELKIAAYARRHNVKPGITGWAQVHGLRGEVTSEDVMRERVEHDLFYIDNWSVGLDLRIIAMTLLSRRAYENAF